MNGKLREILQLTGGEWLISFTTRENPGKLFSRLKDKPLSIDIKEAARKRSRDANAFCWALCSDIGKALTPPMEKEDVYRKAIRAVGVYTQLNVVTWDLQVLVERWSAHGTGWFVDIMDDAGIGRKLVHLYYGSSTYTVQEMRLLLDWLIDQAEQMEIPIPMARKEAERLLEQWGKRRANDEPT